MEITPNTRLVPHPDVVWRLVEGEVVLLNVTTGEYYSLDEVGSRAWALLPADGLTMQALCDALAAEYDAPLGTIAADVRVLFEGLVAAELVVAA